jgi:double-stranded uracil-DNA glycosylase
MTKVNSFAPIANPTATILILGSMPSIASIKANQYYAHPRNAFWPIMSKLFNFEASLSYESRIQALKQANIAVWDVLQSCIRLGSLDSAIKKGSRIPNDFSAFLNQHPCIRLIAFNGAEAEQSFNQYVVNNLNLPKLTYVRLPSTSPAHAIPLAQKIVAWRSIIDIN